MLSQIKLNLELVTIFTREANLISENVKQNRTKYHYIIYNFKVKNSYFKPIKEYLSKNYQLSR